MLICSSSNLRTVETVASSIAKNEEAMLIMRCAHTYDLINYPNALEMAKRLEVLTEQNNEPVAIWVMGKRTK